MAKKRVGKFPQAFRQMAVDRLNQSDNIGELAKELGVHRRLLYAWREKLEPLERGEGPPVNAREATLRKELSHLKRVLAEKVLEVDFFKGALHNVEARRQRSGTSGARADRGIQYASGDYVQLLQQHQMIPSMSRPANPYDKASCDSFLKTLKREEIYANTYRDLVHLRMNMETFIDQYYNRERLHSALGYRPPEEFEHAVGSVSPPCAATMRFFRQAENAGSDGTKRVRDKPSHREVC